MSRLASWRSARIARWGLPLAALAALYGCGGGGGGSAAPAATAAASSWTPGVFEPASDFAALCANPRTGTDPYTNQPYPDRPGSTLDENNWLRSWTHQLYLWYDEVQDVNPALYTTPQYFQLMKTTQTTPSGAPKDRFHFTYPTSVWESLSQAGVQVGYGVQWEILQGSPPRSIELAYLQPAADLPAATVAANLVRGDTLLAVDGVDVVNSTSQASINTINSALSPSTAGETHTFTVEDPGSATPRTVTLQAQNVTEIPVLIEKTLTNPNNGGTVGYILYNEQVATAEPELISAINDLKSKGVTDLILDLRYDGGGYLALASELSYMIAGPNQTAGETFEVQQFNNQYPTTNPVTGQPITPTPFYTTTQLAATQQPLPTLNLTRVAVITGQDTCSASESIINGLEGVGVTVYQIGSTTCGKPYGFYPQDNCGTTYFSIEFQGVNAKGFGGYGDGFSPANTNPMVGVSVPGCSVADDFSHALGDPSEGRIAAALAYLANPQPSTCPSPPTGIAAPRTLSQRQVLDRIFVRSPLTEMRILRR
ncbi:MAG TPA: S41 family peptidase [Steroidobacteraceae bacterium]|nr:S41 family peptidase [Steroidobacteraceae bacterium]